MTPTYFDGRDPQESHERAVPRAIGRFADGRGSISLVGFMGLGGRYDADGRRIGGNFGRRRMDGNADYFPIGRDHRTDNAFCRRESRSGGRGANQRPG